MRFAGKALAIGCAAMAGPLLALAANQVANGLYSSDANDGDDMSDGAFIDPRYGGGFSAYSCPTEDINAGSCTVTGDGGGSGGPGGGGGSGGGTRDCESTAPTPEVRLSCNPGGGGGDPPQEPTCSNVNAIVGISPSDGAKYYVPENVNGDYVADAVEHLVDHAEANGPYRISDEFKDMYSNRHHPHYIDFKDWGTAAGSNNSPGASPITYYS